MNKTPRVRLRCKPVGLIGTTDFYLDEVTLPELQLGEVLTRTLYLAMDPYLTKFMREWQGPEPAWRDGIIVGRTISEVIASRSEHVQEGDVVIGNGEWQDLHVRPATLLSRLPNTDAPSAYLGVLGASGLTAWAGITQVLQASAPHTVTISAAAGTVGAAAGQIAKHFGCHVVGIAGGADKCAYVRELGFDACVDYKREDFEAQLAAATPHGIDRHFENVGAPMLDAAIACATPRAVVALCGLIAHYQDDEPIALARFRDLLYKSIEIRPFHVTHFEAMFPQALLQLRRWLGAGTLRLKETITEGLEHAPDAYVRMLQGKGLGKHLIRCASRHG